MNLRTIAWGTWSEVCPILGGEFQFFWNFHPDILGKGSNLTCACFSKGWFNHHLSWLIETTTLVVYCHRQRLRIKPGNIEHSFFRYAPFGILRIWRATVASLWLELAHLKGMFPKIVGLPSKSSILIGFSIINHPFWGTPIFGNTQICHDCARRLNNTWRWRMMSWKPAPRWAMRWENPTFWMLFTRTSGVFLWQFC